VRAAVKQIDPNLPIHNIRTFENIRDAPHRGSAPGDDNHPGVRNLAAICVA
jgi:hypothetical protein